MAQAGIPCWVDIGSGAQLPAVLEAVTATEAKFTLEAFIQMPPACAVYFSRARPVGRKCRVIHQNYLQVGVIFEGRIPEHSIEPK